LQTSSKLDSRGNPVITAIILMISGHKEYATIGKVEGTRADASGEHGMELR
jgi:hypothetical protein